jgi:hypothetical protein
MNDLSKLIETRIAEEGYADIDGTPCTLERLVRDEPDWACSVIRHYKKRMLGKEAEVERLRGECDALKARIDEAIKGETVHSDNYDGGPVFYVEEGRDEELAIGTNVLILRDEESEE